MCDAEQPPGSKNLHTGLVPLQQDRYSPHAKQPGRMGFKAGLRASVIAKPCRLLLSPNFIATDLVGSLQPSNRASRQACSPSTSMQRQSATFRVEVVVGSARLLIPCGQGDRTVAWLLQQVEKRVSSSHQVCAAVHALMGWMMAVMWLPEAAS